MTRLIMHRDGKLMQMINAKVFHDLATPVTSVSHGVEMLEDSDASRQQDAVVMVQEESKNLVNKIRFYRMTYSSSYDDMTVIVDDIIVLLKNFLSNTNVNFNYHIESSNALLVMSTNLAKAILCATHFSSEIILMHGEVRLQINQDASMIKLYAKGNKKLMISAINMLTFRKGKSNIISLKNCYPHYISLLCSDAKYSLSVECSDNNQIQYFFIKNP